ncbi:L,D-transpeptidase family protein [Isoptericola sp. b515]|uniref:L,D-transpeptidase family protein n=1 Tax=Isoptericola sp. b515 TaxID=3064652 RepID=UPI0027135AE6|nr:L,D-transpeptidase family protein [Isoptericola sp. b515]MDO8147069.1 L,D-transpeptidase family protein [Isoptericola sp. b515]
MVSTHAVRRRRGAVATAVAVMLLLPGCATLSELTAADQQPASSPSAGVLPSPIDPGPSQRPAGSAQEAALPTPPPDPTPSAPPPPTSPAPSAPAPSATPEQEVPDAEQDEQQGTPKEEKKKKEPAVEETRETEEPPAPEPQYLEVGSSGPAVRDLQERLVELGYFLPAVDGEFGPQTQQAVWALQKAGGLSRDAVVGPRTRAALADGVRPAPVSSAGKVVEIDLDRQLLLAVQDGKVVRTFNASSGNGETFEAKGRSYRARTPTGTYAVYMERDYLHESTLELGAMYRPKYFTGGIAVHGSPSIPPWPASHGCIRVSNSAMNWLWDAWGVPRGTTVVVH